ncbi:Membrane protein involved in the export of O-antigen and teichoic acid [Sinosporangium album]|uniref:Membrane protein involved in the export of O-antigen and teichoic acid n=1 Tax=Sinosporangium album TaxID=504805 RepID=A0A1G8AIQ9_9ACTN|nr:polysaccharide biosynthesis C-terminal domain-containing protein [Sinosporangium album]SDH20769.1 Membrane protein involved in the export of O-antigen and teichoic acid [Sinosporangium album]
MTRARLAGLAGAATSGLAQFALVAVVTRAFSTAEAGKFFTAMAVTLMVAGVLKLDAGNGLVYFLSRPHSGDERADASGYIRAALVPPVLVSAAVAVPAAFVPGMQVFALAVPMVVAADILVSATRGYGSMRATLLLEGLALPLGQVGLVAVAAAAGEVAWLPVAWAVPYAVVVVGAALLVARRARGLGACDARGAAGELWRHTAPRSVAGAVQAVFQRMDVVIVAMLAGPVEAAVYTAATRFKVVGQLAGRGLAQAAQPRLVRTLAGGDLDGTREIYQASTRWLVLLTWPIWLGYAAFAPVILRVFGMTYTAGAPVALVLSGTMMLATACGMADVVLTAAGHTTSSMVNLLLAIAVTVALDVLLVPAYGALGAALGWSGGMLVKNLLPLVRIHRLYGLRPFPLPLSQGAR